MYARIAAFALAGFIGMVSADSAFADGVASPKGATPFGMMNPAGMGCGGMDIYAGYPDPKRGNAKAWALDGCIHDILIGPLPTSVYPNGPFDAVLASTHHDFVDIGAITTHVEGGLEDWLPVTKAQVTLAGVGIDLFNVLPGIPLPPQLQHFLGIKVDAINVQCTAKGNQASGSTSLARATITVLNHPVTIPVNLPPNFGIAVNLPAPFNAINGALPSLLLNKQVHNPDGSIEVDAISFEAGSFLETLLLGHINLHVGHVQCGPN